MQWLRNKCHHHFATQIVLQEARSQWETLERKTLILMLHVCLFSKRQLTNARFLQCGPTAKNTMNVLLSLQSLNESEARGRVLGYLVHINDNRTRSRTTHNVSANDAHLKVQSCVTCLVTVSAYNSKGSSPPARVPTLFKTGEVIYIIIIVNNHHYYLTLSNFLP